MHDNITMQLSDETSTNVFNCRIESSTLNSLEDENEYVVELVWRGQHLANTD